MFDPISNFEMIKKYPLIVVLFNDKGVFWMSTYTVCTMGETGFKFVQGVVL